MAMLKRDEAPSTAVVGSDLNALLGRGSEFEGKLTFEGTVRIDGKFSGTIVTTDTLVVGEGARIDAEVNCGTIIVHGEVHGNIRATAAVELHQPRAHIGKQGGPPQVACLDQQQITCPNGQRQCRFARFPRNIDGLGGIQ